MFALYPLTVSFINSGEGAMRTKAISISLIILGVAGSANVLADHNSVWGEGWANMPNDIHNTRIDTLGDNVAFRDFVRYGEGADSVNRFADTSSAQSSDMSRQSAGERATARGR